MADDDSSKRRKITSESTCDNDARIASLDSENHTLKSENARLRQQLLCADAENARLRQRLGNLEGHHDELPVVEQTPTVDLSRFDTSLVTRILSFVGTSFTLRNFALTCKSFGWQQPGSGLDWSLAEQTARQAVCVRGRMTLRACSSHCRPTSGARRRGYRSFASPSTH